MQSDGLIDAPLVLGEGGCARQRGIAARVEGQRVIEAPARKRCSSSIRNVGRSVGSTE